MFITFEGIEGCGKSTQAKLLRDHLIQIGDDVFLTREPGGPKISEYIREILLSNDNNEMIARTEVLLYSASRSQHTGEWIIPLLESGKTVICDRYSDSTLAYQGAARKIDRKVIDSITKFATFDLEPDMTFLIDLPVEIGLSRISQKDADRLEREDIKFHQKVRSAFLDLAEKERKRFIVIDGSKSIEEINFKIIDEFEKRNKR